MRSQLQNIGLGLSFAGVALGACNGDDALCSRKYSEVTFVGAHDSAFVGSGLADNQHSSVADQLNSGVRFLQAQTHKWIDGIELCHTSCVEKDAGRLTDYFSTIKTFLDANPNEVLTILLTNGDGIDINDFAADFESTGLAQYTFVPEGHLAMSEWPTLQSMIDSGRRLVTFMDYDMDESQVPYILDEFSYMFETPYDTTDADFPQCKIDRPDGTDGSGLMMLVNHFLDVDIFGILIPDQLAAETTNSADSILAQADLCKSEHGRKPNFILLDWIDKGEPFAAEDTLNGL